MIRNRTYASSLNTVFSSIRQLENEKQEEEIPVKDIDLSSLHELFREMLEAFNQYNPKIVEPFVKELGKYFPSHQLDPIRDQMRKFSFKDARNETCKLALSLGIKLEV